MASSYSKERVSLLVTVHSIRSASKTKLSNVQHVHLSFVSARSTSSFCWGGEGGDPRKGKGEWCGALPK
jgi:hypothetical protein